jgi:hypothetical protein
MPEGVHPVNMARKAHDKNLEDLDAASASAVQDNPAYPYESEAERITARERQIRSGSGKREDVR